jgi:hypothetical protein
MVSPQDTGTLRVYLRNTTDKPVSIRQVRMSGYPIPVWNVDEDENTPPPAPPPASGDPSARPSTTSSTLPPSDVDHVSAPAPAAPSNARADETPSTQALLLQAAAQQVIWAKFEPKSLPPGEVGEFAGKLRHVLKRTLKIDFVLSTGEEVSQLIHPEDESVAITAITFPRDLATVYAYIESRAPTAQRIIAIEVDGSDVTNSATWTSRSLLPAEKQLAVVPLPAPLRLAAHVTVKVVTSLGVTQERVKVFHDFAIRSEMDPSGSGASSFPASAYPGVGRPFQNLYGDEHCAYASFPTQTGAACILRCLNHIHDTDWGRSAKLALRRYNVCASNAPDVVLFVHPCRSDPLTAFPRFGELVDAVEVNTAFSCDGRAEPKPAWQKTVRTLELARSASAPKPVFAVLSNEKFDMSTFVASREEFRQRAYAILAQAPKSIHFRWETRKDDRNVNREVEAEARAFALCLAPVRHLLAIADTLPAGAGALPADAPLSAELLLAADKAAILVLISNRIADTPSPPPLNAPDKVTLTVMLPGSLAERRLGTIMHLTPDGPKPASAVDLPDRRTLAFPVPALAEAYLLPLADAPKGDAK